MSVDLTYLKQIFLLLLPLLIDSQSCLTLVFAARQVIFVFPIPTANISYQEHWHTSAQGMPWSCMCIVLSRLHIQWCSHMKPAPTALEVQEAGPSSEWTTHLRCLVSIHGHWGAGYLAWPPGLSARDGGLEDGTHRVIPQGISTWEKLASSARPCAEQAEEWPRQ